MKQSTRRLTNILSVTLGIRLLSMMTIIPFFSLYCLELEYSSPLLTGYALGIFGLTQALLQIPFGMLGDRFGYKKMMIIGLSILIVGLLTAASARNIYWMILARSLQGSGAVVTIGYSWISSVMGDDERDKELTRLGGIIGLFTMFSYVLGPILHIFLKVEDMFLFSTALVVTCLFILIFFTKKVNPVLRKKYSDDNKLKKSVFTKNIFATGLMLTVSSIMNISFYFMIPILFGKIMTTNQMWMVFTPSILVSMSLLPVFSKIASQGRSRLLINFLYILEGTGFLLIYTRTMVGMVVGSIAVMTGTFSISTIVPMLANKGFDNRQRGKSNGVILTLQYLGSFLGASITGTLWNISPNIAFIFMGIMVLSGLTLINTYPKRQTSNE